MGKRIDPQAVLPSSLSWANITTKEEILFFGRQNIEYFIQCLIDKRSLLTSKIRKTEDGDERNELIAEKKLMQSYSRYLRRIIKGRKLEEKPLLPAFRQYDYFAIGQQIVCFIDSDGVPPYYRYRFEPSRVFKGYRHNDGIVSFKLGELCETMCAYDHFRIMHPSFHIILPA